MGGWDTTTWYDTVMILSSVPPAAVQGMTEHNRRSPDEVHGRGEALLMAMAGRRGVVAELSGPGQPKRAQRLGGERRRRDVASSGRGPAAGTRSATWPPPPGCGGSATGPTRGSARRLTPRHLHVGGLC